MPALHQQRQQQRDHAARIQARAREEALEQQRRRAAEEERRARERAAMHIQRHVRGRCDTVVVVWSGGSG